MVFTVRHFFMELVMTVSELDRVRVLQTEIADLNAEINRQIGVLIADQCGETVPPLGAEVRGSMHLCIGNLATALRSAWAELTALYELAGLPFIDLAA